MLSAATSDASKANLGNHIITVGLVLQVVTFGLFTAASLRFVVKLRRREMVGVGGEEGERRRWVLICCLWGSCFCIILRELFLSGAELLVCMLIKVLWLGSVYRIVEFSQGYGGYLISHEIYLYIFEAVPMVPPLLLFNIWHPARAEKSVGADVEMSP